MPGLRDRPLMRDALLAGGIIAAGAIAALIALDPGHLAHPHFARVASAPAHPAADWKSSSATAGVAAHRRPGSRSASATIGRNGFLPSSSNKKSADMTVVVMVPDLPPRESPTSPMPNAWSEQGSAAPVAGVNSQGGGPLTMSAVGGVSAPLTSPTGQSIPGAPSASSAHPSLASNSNPAGAPPLGQPAAVTSHNGFVLLAGGQGAGQLALSSAELYDPARNGFAAGAPMKDARTDHTASVLPGGTILIAGGEGPTGRALASAEIYDPASGKFSAVAAGMTAARAEHTATLISGCACPADGKVLLAGGTTASGALGATLKTAELYDPVAGTFTATGAMKASRARHSATLIAVGPLAGNVLIAGGLSDESGGDVATAELYDPVAGQFTSTGAMSTAREGHTATWLAPGVVSGSLAGNVLVAGGGGSSAPSDTAEVFNPRTAAFSPVGAMTTARTLQSAVLLGNGKVLVAGGQSGDTEFLVTAELFDPAHATFAATGSMHNLHAGATATVLDSGSALIAGGRSSFADLYDPAAATFSATGRMVTDLAASTSTLIR